MANSFFQSTSVIHEFHETCHSITFYHNLMFIYRMPKIQLKFYEILTENNAVMFCLSKQYTTGYNSVPWCTTVYHGVPHSTMGCHSVPQCIMGYHSVPWCTTVYHGVPQCTMVYHRVPWGTTVYHGVP